MKAIICGATVVVAIIRRGMSRAIAVICGAIAVSATSVVILFVIIHVFAMAPVVLPLLLLSYVLVATFALFQLFALL